MHRWVWLLALAGCAHSAFAPLQVSSLPGSDKYPTAHTVNLLDTQTLRFKRDPKTRDAIVEREVHWQTRLLKGSGLAAPSVSYSRTFSKISKLEGRVVLPDGTSRDADPAKTVDTTTFSSNELFSDQRVVRLQLPEVPIGGVQELLAVEIYNDVRPWVFPFTFGSIEPTVLARLTIELPSEWEIDLVLEGEIARRDETGEGITRIILEASGVPGFRREPAGPEVDNVRPRAWVRLKSWDSPAGPQQAWATDQELSRWLDVRYQALGDRSGELQATVAQVLKQAGQPASAEEKARVLYEHVARAVQYCAVEIGYGGWIPHSPAEVHKAQYGDCKDKANYLRALLLEAGIDSKVALVHSHTGFPGHFVLPSLGATFNHAILAVKLAGGVVYADPTERTIPFGLLPARDCESPVLVISKEGEKVGVTPSFGPERNTEVQQFVLTIDPSGRGSGSFVISATGVNAAELSYDLLRGTKKKEELLEKWLDLNQLNITAVSKVDAIPFADKAIVTGQLNAGQLISKGAGAVSLIRLREFAPRWLPSLPEEARVTAYGYRWRDTLTGEFEIVLPKGARVTAMPAPIVIDSPFFRYELSWSDSQGGLRVRRKLERKLRMIAQPQFEEFRAAVQQVHVAEAHAAVVRSEGAR